MNFSLFDLFLAGIGVYALIAGIKGSGRLYTNQNVKEGCEEKIMKGQRILYIIVGASMMLNGLSSILLSLLYDREVAETAYVFTPKQDLGSFAFLTPELLSILTFVFMGISLVAITVLFVFLRKMTVKAAPAKKGQGGAAGQAQPQSIFPSAAFNFDDDKKAEDGDQK